LFACNLDCQAPKSPHLSPLFFAPALLTECRRFANLGGGGPRTPESPRSKLLLALNKDSFGGLKIFLLIGSAPGRLGGVGPVMPGLMAGPVVPDWALRARLRRAGAEWTCGVRRLHRDHPVSWRQSLTAIIRRSGTTIPRAVAGPGPRGVPGRWAASARSWAWAMPGGDAGVELSVAEAGPAFVEAGLITADELDRTLAAMRRANADETVLAMMPRMAQVWARKPALLGQGPA